MNKPLLIKAGAVFGLGVFLRILGAVLAPMISGMPPGETTMFMAAALLAVGVLSMLSILIGIIMGIVGLVTKEK